MFPLNAIPTPSNTKFQVFYASSTGIQNVTTGWQVWQKPAGCSMVYIFGLAAGGGGGRPPDGATTVGGGGGGSGGVVRLLIPAALLPDTLYIRPGIGGAGATVANTQGAQGLSSYVSVYPTVDTDATVRASYYILVQGGATGGFASTTAGSAGAATTNVQGLFSSLGLWYSIAGQAGTSGSATANTNPSGVVVFQSGIITSGGGGGGNGTAVGANVLSAGNFFPQTILGGQTAGASGGSGFQKGLPILQSLKTAPLLFTGGAGGAGHSTGTAGRGGDGSYGGGGGGGGGCSGAGTSGNGGNGGDGFVIIGTF
jgi:hypothetical protein